MILKASDPAPIDFCRDYVEEFRPVVVSFGF